MLALRRRDVAELNQLARALMDSRRPPRPDRLTVAGREFAAGDRVVCLRNNDRLGVKNGTRGTVERIDRERANADDRHRRRRPRRAQPPLPRGRQRPPRLRAHRPRRPGPHRRPRLRARLRRGRLQEWGYVALSRARAETRLYVTGTPREHESALPRPDDRDPLTRLAQALEESAVERLAIDQHPLERAPNTRPAPKSSAPSQTTS